MALRVSNKTTVIYETELSSVELHPFWLRERGNNCEIYDRNSHQRLTNTAADNHKVSIVAAKITGNILSIDYSDGINITCDQTFLERELLASDAVIERTLWSTNTSGPSTIDYELFNEDRTLVQLLSFLDKYGYVLMTGIPTSKVSILDIAAKIGSVRPTNFGDFFVVKAKPRANDLAYTSQGLVLHTDNPYRNPVPSVQLLLCITNECEGGETLLVDGFAVAQKMRTDYPDLFDVLVKTIVNFRFEDSTIVMENSGPLIELDSQGKVKQVRFNTKMDYIPHMDKNMLSVYYEARSIFSTLIHSDEFVLKFRLKPGELLFMDNHRTLHGRTGYQETKGHREIHGCYQDFDSTRGKRTHLLRSRKADHRG